MLAYMLWAQALRKFAGCSSDVSSIRNLGHEPHKAYDECIVFFLATLARVLLSDSMLNDGPTMVNGMRYMVGYPKR